MTHALNRWRDEHICFLERELQEARRALRAAERRCGELQGRADLLAVEAQAAEELAERLGGRLHRAEVERDDLRENFDRAIGRRRSA
jgi:hypothetical protein